MREKPLNIALTAWTDQDYRESVDCTAAGQPFDFSTWTDLELVAAESVSSPAAAFHGVVTATGGNLAFVITEAELKALLPAAHLKDSLTYQYVLRGRPVGTYRVRLMYGTFKLSKGLPE